METEGRQQVVVVLDREEAQRLVNLCEKHYTGALDPAYHFKKQLEAALTQKDADPDWSEVTLWRWHCGGELQLGDVPTAGEDDLGFDTRRYIPAPEGSDQ